jgi:hypothetical protein
MTAHPRLILVGNSATDYVGHALALHRKFSQTGLLRQTVLIDGVIVLLSNPDIKILAAVPRFAVFVWDQIAAAFCAYWLETAPKSFPALTPAHLPTLPTFWPLTTDNPTYPATGSAMVTLYDRLNFYATPQNGVMTSTVMFQGPILSVYGESLVWDIPTEYINPATGNRWALLRYFLEGYYNVNDLNINTKLVNTSQDANNLYETDYAAPNVYAISQSEVTTGLELPGIRYHVLPEMVTAYIHDATTYSGTLFKVTEASDQTFDSVPLAITPAPHGARLTPPDLGATPAPAGSRHMDNMLDIFTSPAAKHYYIVRLTVDNAVNHYMGLSDYSYDPSGSDTVLFPGTALTVDKVRKSDMALVQIYNLTPSSRDYVLQGFRPSTPETLAAVGYPDNPSTYGWALNGRLVAWGQLNTAPTFNMDQIAAQTRIIPQNGYVLVDSSGNEYPILTGSILTQDGFGSVISAINGGGTSGKGMDVFCQAVVLWLGTPPSGVDCYTWDGVDAAGLKLSTAQPGLRNDAGIGDMHVHYPGIGDSNSVMLQLVPILSGNIFDTVNYSVAQCTVRCSNFRSRDDVDDKGGITIGDQFFVDNQFVFTVTDDSSGSMVANAVNGIMAGINAQGIYSATDAVIVDSSGISTFTLTRKDGTANKAQLGYTSIWGYRMEQRMVSVQLVGGIPTLRLEAIINRSQSVSMFAI